MAAAAATTCHSTRVGTVKLSGTGTGPGTSAGTGGAGPVFAVVAAGAATTVRHDPTPLARDKISLLYGPHRTAGAFATTSICAGALVACRHTSRSDARTSC